MAREGDGMVGVFCLGREEGGGWGWGWGEGGGGEGVGQLLVVVYGLL